MTYHLPLFPRRRGPRHSAGGTRRRSSACCTGGWTRRGRGRREEAVCLLSDLTRARTLRGGRAVVEEDCVGFGWWAAASCCACVRACALWCSVVPTNNVALLRCGSSLAGPMTTGTGTRPPQSQAQAMLMSRRCDECGLLDIRGVSLPMLARIVCSSSTTNSTAINNDQTQ